jgi:hypothetical protein
MSSETRPLLVEASFPARIVNPPPPFPVLSGDEELSYHTDPFVWTDHSTNSQNKCYFLWLGLSERRNWKVDDVLVFLNEFLFGWITWNSARTYFAKDDESSVRHQLTFRYPGDHRQIVRVSIPPRKMDIEITAGWSRLDSAPWQKSEVQDGEGMPFVRYSIHQCITRYQSYSILRCLPIVQPNSRQDAGDAVSRAALIVIRRRSLFPGGLSAYKRAFIGQLGASLHSAINTTDPSRERFRSYGGYLKLHIQPFHRWDKLDTYDVPGGAGRSSIAGGCYIHRRAPSILRYHLRNNIKGLLLDTTWSVMQNYVTAILVGVAYNTAVPLSFAFGAVEAFELYEIFFNIFRSVYDIDLADFKVESDQGSGLKKYCETHQIVHRL